MTTKSKRDPQIARTATGLPALDLVLGGGLVAGSVVLLAAPVGLGKTTLSLQALSGIGRPCLYATGEETIDQVAATARRIGATSKELFVVAERDLVKVFVHARTHKLKTIAIDTIQTLRCEDVGGKPGSPTQLKACVDRLVQFAKTTGTTIWLNGHMTSAGAVSGPRTIEHDVDTVLELASWGSGNARIVRITKNRFGPTATGRFELTAKGFVDASN